VEDGRAEPVSAQFPFPADPNPPYPTHPATVSPTGDGTPDRERCAVRSRTNKPREAETPDYYSARSEAIAAIAQQEGLDLVVLFGSAAKGRLRPESDVDVAVRFTQGRPGFETEARVAGELHQALQPPRELDLVVLNGASPLLLANVAAEGIVLYAATSEVWPRFWLYARRRFEDTAKYRQRRWEALKERLGV
jgi:predicted nucleotidyltransferase